MKKILFFLTVLLFFTSGCNYFKKLFFKQPEIISIKNLNVTKLSMSENVILSMSMIVNNRNSIDAKVTNSDFDVSINGTFLGKGKLDVPFVLQADKVSEIKGEVSTTYSNFMKSGVNILGTLLSNNKVLYKASGTIEVIVTDFNINVSVPFEIENNLTISVQ